MRWPDPRGLRPLRMQRVGVLAPRSTLPEVLALVGQDGTVELDCVQEWEPAQGPPLISPGSAAAGNGSPAAVAGRAAPVQVVVEAATGPAQVAAVLGWMPAERVAALNLRLAPLGGAVTPLPAPPGRIPPTLLAAGTAGRNFDLLVQTYSTVPYADVDPTLVAGLAYAVMFGVMFGDAGHGAVLILLALLLKAGRLPFDASARVRAAWPFLAGGGAVSVLTGLLYGEVFGPTRIVPVLWLDPLDEPVTLLLSAIGAGAVLLAGAYALGVANRVREGGWTYALYSPAGVAGALLFLGLGCVAAGVARFGAWVVAGGSLLAAVALTLAFLGLLAASTGGAAGAVQAVVELVDLVVRLGSNLVSFARLAAFGLTHAALTTLVWSATTAAWRPGPGMLAAVTVFVAGNVLTLALETVVAGIQALRLEYYELFSRVFTGSGRPFHPWRPPPDGSAPPPIIPAPREEAAR